MTKKEKEETLKDLRNQYDVCLKNVEEIFNSSDEGDVKISKAMPEMTKGVSIRPAIMIISSYSTSVHELQK